MKQALRIIATILGFIMLTAGLVGGLVFASNVANHISNPPECECKCDCGGK